MTSENKSFCVLPWRHLAIDAAGTFRMCCRAGDIIRDGTRIPSVYTDTIEEIWQSPALQQIRATMLAGEQVRGCQVCYTIEQTSGQSARLFYNREWIGQHPDEAAPEEYFAGKLSALPPPDHYHVVLGNTCNLSCRMCDSNYSSQIKADSVHSAWAPVSGGAEIARWHGERVEIAPRPKFGVNLRGFSTLEWRDGVPTRWIGSGGGTIDIRPDVEQLIALELDIVTEQAGATLSVVTDAETQVSLPAGLSGHRLPLAFTPDSPLRIRLVPGNADARIGLRAARLVRPSQSGNRNEVFSSRFVGKRDWTEQNALLFHEILKDPGRLRALTIQGGEPMLLRKFPEMIDFLIDTGAAAAIELEVTSNGTIWNADFAGKLKKFRRALLRISVDGFGPYYEYIRHPAHWATVSETIGKYSSVPDLDLRLQPVLQVYNALNITELLRYADERGLRVELQTVYWPYRLSTANLPWPIRHEAAARLRRYRDEGGRQDITEAVGYLENAPSLLTEALFDELVAFTNDLDGSRGQSFAVVHRELLNLLADSGWHWSDRRRHLAV